MASNEAVSGPASFKNRRLFQRKIKVRTYILPTGFGYAFGITSIVLFFLAVGYANNLIYIFVFLLISVALTGMVITDRNTDALEVLKLQPESFFAGEVGRILVTVKNNKNTTLWDFEFFFQKSSERIFETSFAANAEEKIEAPFGARTRGLHPLPRFIVQSKFPFELFRAWKAVRDCPSVLVYPARTGQSQFPASSVSADLPQNAGLFRDHRVYQSSDSTMRIDWRASARRQDLLVKNFEEGEKPSLGFHWQQTEHIQDRELRLCQLSLWVDEAERKGHEYSLEIGGTKTSFDRGPSHHRKCLEILAKIELESLS